MYIFSEDVSTEFSLDIIQNFKSTFKKFVGRSFWVALQVVSLLLRLNWNFLKFLAKLFFKTIYVIQFSTEL